MYVCFPSFLLLLTTAEVCFPAMSLFILNLKKKSVSELLFLTTLRSQRGKPDFTSVTKISYLASVGQKEIKKKVESREWDLLNVTT